MIIARAYAAFVAALNDGLSRQDAIAEAVHLFSHQGVTVRNLSAFIEQE